VYRYYGPIVEEGSALFARVSDEQLARMRDWLLSARGLTDRHRDRIRG
jgi:hypothetical protein